ncbi:DUF2806 domain-containing protein [Bosea sp. MMO-172]|uniref:DUF2806 domain-containing protein n=1 Tax=Bosea sp. MMO-172 TaxID=3127885 RepID=UPI00301B258F
MNDIVPTQSGQGIGPWLGEWIANGKLPGAVKAIAHVVGATGNLLAAGIDIGKAKADQISQGIKDETEARSVMKAALARQASEMLPEHKEFAHRAMQRWFADELRKQSNREAVAELAAESIASAPPEQIDQEPSEDWLNVFSEHAEKASTDRVRTLLGKILAGEIRKPGEFPISALRILASTDAEGMILFSKICSVTSEAGYIIRTEFFNSGIGLDDVHDLEAYGLVQAGPLLSRVFDYQKGDKSFLVYSGYCIAIDALVDFRENMPSVFLTKAGMAIYRIMDIAPDTDGVRAAAEFIENKLRGKAEVSFCSIHERRILDSVKIG